MLGCVLLTDRIVCISRKISNEGQECCVHFKRADFLCSTSETGCCTDNNWIKCSFPLPFHYTEELFCIMRIG